MFSIARDWLKRVTWLDIPENSKLRVSRKIFVNTTASIWLWKQAQTLSVPQSLHSFRAMLAKNCSLLATANVCGQLSCKVIDHQRKVEKSTVFETLFINTRKPCVLDGIKDVRAHCYCASLVRTLFIGHARATSFSSARTDSKTQQNVERMTFALTWCANIFVGCSVTPTFFSADHFLFWLFSSY